MTKEELLALEITEEQANKVLEGYKGYVPKARFDEINEAKKKAESTVAERDKQLEELQKNSGNAEELQEQIAKLQEENKAAADKYAEDLKELQIANTVERELVAAGAKNVKAVKALLELKDAELDGENIKGLADQLKKLKEDETSKFLFEDKTSAQFTGLKPGQGKAGAPAPKKLSEMTYSELAAYMAEHPNEKID